MNNHLLLKLFLDNYVGILLMKYKKIVYSNTPFLWDQLKLLNQRQWSSD